MLSVGVVVGLAMSVQSMCFRNVFLHIDFTKSM